MMRGLSRDSVCKTLLVLALVFNIMVWFYARNMRAEWINVPPVPTKAGALSFALGDSQLAYRTIGLMLQNLGDMGGRSTPLKDYNYVELGKWFFLEDQLDPKSTHIPALAAFYFTAVQTPEVLYPVLDYLAYIGSRSEGEQWRWLAQAVMVARYIMQDMDKALELANKLAEIDNPDMPAWPRQLRAFILEARGDKVDAMEVMVNILKTEGAKMPVQEVNFMREYICTRLMNSEEATGNPLCENIP